jgi:hypothetical protein
MIARAAVFGFALLLGLTGPARAALAGAWTQARGHVYFRAAVSGVDTDERFDVDGERVPFQESGAAIRDTEYRSRELRLYAEYGITDLVTGYGSLAYARLRMEQVSVRYETNGAADLYLGVRYRLTRGGPPVSVSGEVKVPTGYATEETPALGAGTADGTARLLAGISRGRSYGTAEAGFTLRAGDFQNELLYAAEVGWSAPRTLSARAVLRGRRALGEPSPETGASPLFDPGLASPRLATIDGVLGFEVARGVTLETGISRVLGGRNALAGTALEVALAWSGAAGSRR